MGVIAAQLLPFARMLTAAGTLSSAAELVPRAWSALRCGNLVTHVATAVPQMRGLSLTEGSSVSELDDSGVAAHYDAIED